MSFGVFLTALALVAGSCSKGESSTTPSTTTIPQSTEFAGYVRSPALNVSSVTLPTVNGTPINMVAKQNGLLLVYFGYTECPDICPTTLSNLRAAVAKQPMADQKRVQVAMITIDPSRDTGKKFAKYVEQFFPTGYAIRTDDPVLLRSSANVFGADYRLRTNEKGNREVTHSADLYVIDDTGTVILAWPYGLSPDAIKGDLHRLLAGDRPSSDEPGKG